MLISITSIIVVLVFRLQPAASGPLGRSGQLKVVLGGGLFMGPHQQPTPGPEYCTSGWLAVMNHWRGDEQPSGLREAAHLLFQPALEGRATPRISPWIEFSRGPLWLCVAMCTTGLQGYQTKEYCVMMRCISCIYYYQVHSVQNPSAPARGFDDEGRAL